MRSNDAFSRNILNSFPIQVAIPFSMDKVVGVVRDDSNEDVHIRQIKLVEERESLQNVINILQQKVVYLYDILKDNKAAYDQNSAKLKRQFEEQRANLILQSDNEQQRLKATIETQQEKIQKQQQTIKEMTANNEDVVEEYERKIALLSSTIRRNDTTIEQLVKDNDDKRIILRTCDEKLDRQDAEIHELQMITTAEFYLYNFNATDNYQRPRATARWKVSISTDTRRKSSRSQVDEFEASYSCNALISPLIFQRTFGTNNGSISIFKSMSGSATKETTNVDDDSRSLCDSNLKTESKESKRDERSQTY